MNTVIIDVRSLADNLADFAAAWKTGQASGPRISFESSEALWKTLTAKRWQLLKVLTGAGPVSIREAARRVGRDVKAVHGDIRALLNAGLLDKTEDGKIVFPVRRYSRRFYGESGVIAHSCLPVLDFCLTLHTAKSVKKPLRTQ